MTTSFLGLEPPFDDYERARIVVLPVPYERTTSYGQGTSDGPAALLEASTYLELWDEELSCEPADLGIATLEPVATDGDAETVLARIESSVARHLDQGKFVAIVGGEHSLSLAPARAVRSQFGEIGVVQFDAHADLRETYEGSRYSHACVMKRIHDEGIPSVGVGIRSLSRPEAELVADAGLDRIWGHELAGCASRFAQFLDRLPPKVFLTFDVDFLDPSICPGTGTPEPGGGLWNPTLKLLEVLFARKEVVALDVVELAPLAGQPASAFTAAKLLYKCLGYRFRDELAAAL